MVCSNVKDTMYVTTVIIHRKYANKTANTNLPRTHARTHTEKTLQMIKVRIQSHLLGVEHGMQCEGSC